MTEPARNGARSLVRTCAGLSVGEKVCILYDHNTLEVARIVQGECLEVTANVQMLKIAPLGMHGASPPPEVGDIMCSVDVFFCLTASSLAHSKERKRATDRGVRFLSLPDYSVELLGRKSLMFDFHGAIYRAEMLTSRMNVGEIISVVTDAGTDIRFSVRGRTANCCPGVCVKPGTLGSPPDVEVNIAPIEDSINGVLIVDGSIPCREIGLISSDNIRLIIENGKCTTIEGGENAEKLRAIFDRHSGRARIVGEFGIGLNSDASLSGYMLEDEGCANTAHFGFGSNVTIGGENDVDFHLDCVIMNPLIEVDGVKLGVDD